MIDRRSFLRISISAGITCLATSLMGCSNKIDLKEEVIGTWRNTHMWKNEGDEQYGYVKGEYYTDTLEIFEGGTDNWSCIRDSTGEELKGWLVQWEVEDDVFNLIIPSMLGSVTYGYKLSDDGTQLVSVRDSEDVWNRV